MGAFYQRFYGVTAVTPHPKELAHATELLATQGEAKAHFLLAFAHQAATETHYQPQVFGGILQYLPRALGAYDAQAARTTQAATQRVVMDYYVVRQPRGGAVLAARLLAADLVTVRKEVNQIARSITITRAIDAKEGR